MVLAPLECAGLVCMYVCMCPGLHFHRCIDIVQCPKIHHTQRTTPSHSCIQLLASGHGCSMGLCCMRCKYVCMLHNHCLTGFMHFELVHCKNNVGFTWWHIGLALCMGKVFNPVLKLVFENYPFSCLSQLRSPHFTCASV